MVEQRTENPRVAGSIPALGTTVVCATPPTNLITTTYGGCPLFLFHLLEFLDVDWELDLAAVQARWTDYDNWTQLVLKATEDRVELITRAPRSGIWRLLPEGGVAFHADAWSGTSLRLEGNEVRPMHDVLRGCSMDLPSRPGLDRLWSELPVALLSSVSPD